MAFGAPEFEVDSLFQYKAALVGKLKALIDMLLRWLGHLYACAALTKSCNEGQLSHDLTVE